MDEESNNNNMDAKQQQMDQLRALLLGEENQQITGTVKKHAREIVGDVFSEALHDRQEKDGSVDQVIIPLVEKSVERSVSNHSEKMVGYLYPLMGRLIRKSVSAFLTEFLEKTNELIENSLTIKGLKWRFRAWQAGVSFSQYVASQTFVYKVEQILLIHRETGILLKSVSQGHGAADADMVSGMLTAIDDFVSDSFNAESENEQQHLDVIKTDDFSLVLKRGPQAVIVAAVTGNMPQEIANQLELTLEFAHRIYDKELASFKGDTLPFEPLEQQLKECLLEELRPEENKANKQPWFAWLIVLFVCSLSVTYGYFWWNQNELKIAIEAIKNEPGFVLNDVDKSGLTKVKVTLLRDPSALSVDDWLLENDINKDNLDIEEKRYLSLAPELLKLRLTKLLADYPELTVIWEDNLPVLTGKLPNAKRQALSSKLLALPGLNEPLNVMSLVEVEELDNRGENNPAILKALLELNIAKVDSIQLEFDQGQSGLSDLAKEQLKMLANNFQTVVDLADKQNLSLGLIIMGASDPVGGREYNQRLSRDRARAAQKVLVEQGVDPGYLNAIGLGIVESKTTGKGVRKVLFNVVYFDSD